MSDPTATYTFHAKGLWKPCLRISDSDGELGTLTLRRNRWGMVTGAAWRPLKGEKIDIRRDPGILRSQFSLWSEGREWLGASLRWSFIGRIIDLSTGTKAMRLVPLAEFSAGWTLHAPKTGRMAKIHLGSSPKVDVYRRVNFEVVLFALFLSYLSRIESYWPGPVIEDVHDTRASVKAT